MLIHSLYFYDRIKENDKEIVMGLDVGMGGFDIMFTIVPIMIGVIFIMVIGTFISRGANYASQKAKPEQAVAAKVISKRQHVWGDRSHTNYYATFELENSERVEYLIPAKEIGFLVEGDYGILRHQGTLFVGFSRETQYESYE